MNQLCVDDLVRLKQEPGGGPRMSLFLPLSPGASRGTKVRIRAKNVLLRAGQALRADGLPGRDRAQILGRAEEVLDHARPMGATHLGLAVFADAERARQFRVPIRVPELAAIGSRFTISPLLPAIDAPAHFYVLALDQAHIRLFQGTPLSLEQVDAEGLEVAAWSTMPRPRPAQVHAFLADRGGHGSTAVYHGVDRESDDRKARALHHFRGVDLALRELLQPSQAPLILAGARHLQALYRAANTYPHLLEPGIDSSPDQMSTEELTGRAWAVAESETQRNRSDALARYRDLRGTGRTLDTVSGVHRAAVQGRVQTILIDERACAWPALAAHEQVLRLGRTASPDEEIESAVVETLRRSGSAFVVPEAEWPERSTAAAILRY